MPVGRAQHRDDRVQVEAVRPFEPGLKNLTERHPQLLKAFGKFSKWTNQMGTLGGGNHLIEVCLDEHDQVWVMLHSGSRGIGNAIASYFIELARKDMARHMIQLPDRDLVYFEVQGRLRKCNDYLTLHEIGMLDERCHRRDFLDQVERKTTKVSALRRTSSVPDEVVATIRTLIRNENVQSVARACRGAGSAI